MLQTHIGTWLGRRGTKDALGLEVGERDTTKVDQVSLVSPASLDLVVS